jgi:hypothetical protein
VHQSHLQKTQLPLFTELLSGNMSIKSITIWNTIKQECKFIIFS